MIRLVSIPPVFIKVRRKHNLMSSLVSWSIIRFVNGKLPGTGMMHLLSCVNILSL